MDGSRYVAAYLIILLAQREENIVPPFSRRNPLVNLSGAFIVMASTMVPCRSVLLAQREWKILSSLFIVLWDFYLLWNNIFILNFVTEMINTN